MQCTGKSCEQFSAFVVDASACTSLYTREIEQSNADINWSKLMFVVIWCKLFDSHAFIDRH